MKVKNIAFSGFAAAILATGAANAAPEIASKAYVENMKTSTLTEVSNTYVKDADLSGKITDELHKETSALKTEVSNQVVNNITQVLQDSNSDLAKALADKAAASDVEALQTTVGNATSGLVKAVTDVTDKANQNTSDITALDGRVTKNETDIKALNEGLADKVNAEIGKALSGDGDIKDAIDSAISDAVKYLPVGELQTDVDNLKTAINGEDGNGGLTKDVADNKTAIEANTSAIEKLNGGENDEGSVKNTISTMAIAKPKPEECDAESQLCVLSYKKNGDLGWVGVTMPLDEEDQ